MRKLLYQTFVLEHKDGETAILQDPKYILGKSHVDVYAKIVRKLTKEQAEHLETLEIVIRPISGEGRGF